VITRIGNGANTLFWSDKWLNGAGIRDIAPEVVAKVGKRSIHSRTVAQALENWQWVSDIRTPLSLAGLQQYLLLWDAVSEVELSEVPDQHRWRHAASGVLSSQSCYQILFTGSATFEPWKRLWKSWAPPKCKFFLWLAMMNTCWTADRLEKRGLPHPVTCPLCDQQQETIQHLLNTCIFTRQFWNNIISPFGLGHFTPSIDEPSFADWWKRLDNSVHRDKRKGLNSAIILGAWCLWLHRNKAVFNGESSLARLQRCFLDELRCWVLAGAKNIGSLGLARALNV
jgi:hypothetical protein